MNRTIFFGFNTRTSSYFVGSELASSGLPEGKELEILDPYKDQLPPELFTQEYKLPVYATPQDERTHLRKVVRLFGEAGWKIQNGKMTNEKTGEPFKIEILGNDATDEAIANPYINMLRKLGIDASLRIVDPSQYVNRVHAISTSTC